MQIESTTIEDTFAEGFSTRFTRIIITATNPRWLTAAVQEVCGYGSSVIGCDAETGLERWLGPEETLDGRVGASILMFAFSTAALQTAVANRIGQCVMTCPTTAVFDGLSGLDNETVGLDSWEAHAIPVGDRLRYFGDGFQKSKLIGDRRFWRIPVMDGEFVVEDSVGVAKGVAGGNFLILAESPASGLSAAEAAVAKIEPLPNVILPFPGGVVRSGSKVGSRYPKLVASTSDAFCPTLRGRVETRLPANIECVYELVIDGTDATSVATAMREGILAAIATGVPVISAGNYGGQLGKHHFHLQPLLAAASAGDLPSAASD